MSDDVFIQGQLGGSIVLEAEEGAATKRILAGLAVPYGEVGFTNWGPVRFEEGALDAALRPPLDRDHDSACVIGVVKAATNSDAGLAVKAKVSEVLLGDETLVLAADGAITGFSVTVRPTEYSFAEDDKWGEVMVVAKGEWVGLAVTPYPAFDSARISKVAASRRAAVFASATNNPKGAPMGDTLTLDPAVAASFTKLADELAADRTTRLEAQAAASTLDGERLEAKRARLAKKVDAEVVKAGLTLADVVDAASGSRTKKLDELTVDELEEARADIKAAEGPAKIELPVNYAEPKRKVFASAGDAAWHMIRAGKGNAESAARVAEAWKREQIEAALSEVTTAEIPGLMPPAYATDLITALAVATPIVDNAYRHTPLPPYGMSIIKPKWDVPPDGDWYTVENSQPATNVIEIGTQTVSVLRYAHAIRASIDAVERSAFGGLAQRYYDAVTIDYMSKKEAKATDVLVDAAQETATVGATPQAIIGELVGAVIENQQDGDGNFRGLLPNFAAVAPDVYGTLVSTTTLNGFAFANGSLNYGEMQGTLAGLRIFMAPAMDAGGILVGSTAASVAYDGNDLQLRALIVSTMSYELGVYAWTAFDVDYPDALACNFLASN